MTDFEQMLRAAMAGETPAEKLSIPEQRRALRMIYEAKGIAYDFEPGDLLRHKWPQYAHLRQAGGLFVFLEYLEEPLPLAAFIDDHKDFFSPLATQAPDCKVGCFTEDTYLEYFADSSEFEPDE